MANHFQEFPLHKAASEGDVARVRQLLTDGIKIDARTRSNETALIAAAGRGRLDVVQCLIEAGANLDAKTKSSAIDEGRLTALHRAVAIGHYRIAKSLLEAGAEVDALSQNHITPLVRACYADNIEMIRLLLDYRANPNGCAAGYDTPLVVAAGFLTASITERQNLSEDRTVEIVRELVRRGASPNLEGCDGFPLHATRSVAVTKVLLEAGADVNALNRNGQTPLLQWALTAKLELLQCLLDAGADVNFTSKNGDTPLRRIFERNPPEIETLELLVRAGGDINAVDQWGRSLLDYYVRIFEPQQRERCQAEIDCPTLAPQLEAHFCTNSSSRYIQFIKDRGARSAFVEKPPKRKSKIEKDRT